jgi:hypothetical protein
MENALYVIGGRQRTPRPLRAGNSTWNGYDEAVILRINPWREEWKECVTYIPPPDVYSSEHSAITFQSGTIKDDVLYVCTQTEVLLYKLPDFERIAYLSLPIFNDLHHVHPTPAGTLLIANAGLEMVLELTLEGEVCNVWNVLGEQPRQLASETDFRKVSTKPHRSHPNYLFYLDSEPWATRFHQGDAVCVTQAGPRIEISNERIHDGLVHHGQIFFTSVNGWIYIASSSTLRVEQAINLHDMHPDGTLLGWCRSLFVDGDKLWVGFSRIRPTKWRENVSWVARGFKKVHPTHIACYDLTNRECMIEVNLEPMGLNAIYSIFPAR